MGVRAGTGVSLLRDGAKAATEAARRALGAAGLERSEAAFVFATTEHAARYEDLIGAVAAATGAQAVAGCSAAGVLTEEGEIEAGPAIGVLAAGGGLDIEAGILPEAAPADLGRALGILAKRLSTLAEVARAERAREASAILLFPDMRTFEAAEFFAGLDEAAGFLPVVGGAASGRGGRSFQFGGGKVVEGRAATAIVRGGPLGLEVAVAQGCAPIGKPAVITRAEGAVIKNLAGRPALEVLAEALESAGIGEIQSAETPVSCGIAIDPKKHPLGRGDFLIRPIVGADESSGSIALTEKVRVGQTVGFQVLTPEAAGAELEAALGDLRVRLGGREPCFGLYFDCLGRGSKLYGERDHDVRAIRRHFPRMPFAGFLSNGEIAPVARRNFLHTYAGVLAIFCTEPPL